MQQAQNTFEISIVEQGRCTLDTLQKLGVEPARITELRKRIFGFRNHNLADDFEEEWPDITDMPFLPPRLIETALEWSIAAHEDPHHTSMFHIQNELDILSVGEAVLEMRVAAGEPDAVTGLKAIRKYRRFLSRLDRSFYGTDF